MLGGASSIQTFCDDYLYVPSGLVVCSESCNSGAVPLAPGGGGHVPGVTIWLIYPFYIDIIRGAKEPRNLQKHRGGIFESSRMLVFIPQLAPTTSFFESITCDCQAATAAYPESYTLKPT